MTPVVSSNLSGVGYSRTLQILRVRFKHGGVYDYYNVPEFKYTDFMNSQSKGKYFRQSIKEAYKFRRIT